MQEITMTAIPRFALALAASALAAPAYAFTGSYGVDFEWYANAGRSVPATQAAPAPRLGYIWSPNQWQTHGTGQTFVAGHWIVDDYAAQVEKHDPGPRLVLVTDPRGELILKSPAAYPANR
jgi:hypothetical protein